MKRQHVCPVWVGWFLACPLRRILENPENVVGPYAKKGMRVLDVGSAMGFYSLPLARMVGPTGKVIAVDLQQGMIKGLEKRASRAGLLGVIETRLCAEASLGLDGLREQLDFALASAVVHEVPDRSALFRELAWILKPGAALLMLEPKGRVSAREFEQAVALALENGFQERARPRVPRSRSALFAKGSLDADPRPGSLPDSPRAGKGLIDPEKRRA